VLSLELVTGAGEKVHFGSRSVKDVAGYEVIGLLLGGGGRYGMITEVTLRLIPKPAGSVKGSTGTAGSGRVIGKEGGPYEALSERVQKVFDPEGILRW